MVHSNPSELVWGQNQMYGACCFAQSAHKLVKPPMQSRQQVLRAYCPNIYTVGRGQRGREPHDNLKTNNLPFHM